MIVITESPRPEVHLKFPKLMTSQMSKNIYLIVGVSTKGIKGTNLTTGVYREDWASRAMIDYEGTVTLENGYER